MVGEHGAFACADGAGQARRRHHRRRPDARRLRGDGRDRHRLQEPRLVEPYNIVRATLDGLKRCGTPAEIAAKRGLTVEEIARLTRREQHHERPSRADKKTVKIKLVKSVAGTRESHRATVRGLGLRKTNSESTLEDTPAVRGMIDKVSYLVKVL